MKNVLIFYLLASVSVMAQPTERYRFETDASVSTLALPAPYRAGWHLRQQITGYFRPRLGIALGIGWGASANTDPLTTKDPASPDYSQPDPARLGAFYTRQEYMTDLSVVVLPILSRRHQVKLQAGLSVYRRREIGVDSLFREDPRLTIYRTTGKFTDTRRITPMAALSYDFRLSPRWGVGINGTAYFTGNSRPTTTVGIRATYRFGLFADSLDMKPIPWKELHAGVRLGGSFVGENNMSPAGRYRTRFLGGLWAELPLSLTWALRGELNYAQRGYRIDEVDLGNVRYLAGFANVNYLEMPLLFRHEIAYRWHLYTGPYLAFFLNGYTETNGQRNQPISPNTRTGLLVGASYDLTERLSADLRYQRDLLQLSSRPYGGFHSFQATLNWAFR